MSDQSTEARAPRGENAPTQGRREESFDEGSRFDNRPAVQQTPAAEAAEGRRLGVRVPLDPHRERTS